MSTGNQWQPPGGWQPPPQTQPPPNWPQPGQTTVIVPPGEATDTAGRVQKWIFGQPAIVVLLFVFVGMAGWLGRYVVTTGVPAHLQQIQNGYERINAENNQANAARDAHYTAELREVRAESARREALLREFLKMQPPQGQLGAKAAAAAAADDEGKPGT